MEVPMKKLLLCVAIMCIILCGCGEGEALNDSKIEKIESEDVSSSQNEESNENTEKDIVNSETHEESDSIHKETREEYIERMNNIYSEIKEEAAKIGQDQEEILFNGVLWGSDFTSMDTELQEKDGTYLIGMLNAPVSISSRIGIRMELDARYTDFSSFDNIAGVARAKRKEMKVAGYEVEDCMLLFSAVFKDDTYILSNEDSALYAAQYTIKPVDSEAAMEDLKNKISSIYGEPDSIRDIEPYENALTTNEYIYWYGANDTVLVLSSTDSGQITISYVWLGGEELLNAALDNAEKELSESEESVYGNGNTTGL